MPLSNLSIADSLKAIQQYDPSSKTFLQVVGKGAGQHLAVVKKNWFGRLLMWLGFSSASMKKVVAYVAEHIGAFCQHAKEFNREHLKSLGRRFARYDNRHSNKLFESVQKIKHTLWTFDIRPAKLLAPMDQLVSLPAPARPTLSPPILAALKPDPEPKPAAAPPTEASLPTLPLLPAPPPAPIVNLAPAPSPTPTPLLQVSAPKAAPVVDSAAEFELVKDSPEKVYQLLRKYGRNFTQFKKLIEAMTPDQVFLYASCNTPKDLFDLDPSPIPDIRPGMVYLYMSLDKMKKLIEGTISTTIGASLCNNIVREIIYHRFSDLAELLDHMVQLSLFKLTMMNDKDPGCKPN